MFRFDYLKDLEVDAFRRSMIRFPFCWFSIQLNASVRQEAAKQRHQLKYTLLPELDFTPITNQLKDKLTADNKVPFRLHVLFAQMVKTVACSSKFPIS